MMQPVDETSGLEHAEYGLSPNDDDKARRSSWMGRRSPFLARRLSGGHHNNINNDYDLMLSPESNSGCERSPLRKTSGSRISSPPPSLSPLLLREKLINSIPVAVKQHYSRGNNTNENNTALPYENVETLLEALRMERHQEKLRAEEEIKQLKEKLASYETQTRSNRYTSSPGAPNNNKELADCLMETLALLEEECAEWQNTSSLKRRQSLGNVTNNHLSPSPQKLERALTTPPFKTPRQKTLERSIQRLRAASSQLKEQSTSSKVMLNFEQEAFEYSDDDLLVGLGVLEDESGSILSFEKEDVPVTSPTPLDGSPTLTFTPSPIDDYIETDKTPLSTRGQTEGALEDEVQGLRQQLWNQMLDNNKRVEELKKQIHSIQEEKDQVQTLVDSTTESQKQATEEAAKEKKRAAKVTRECQELKEEVTRLEGIAKQCELQLASLEKFSEDVMESSCNQLHSKDRELLRARTDFMVLQERMISEVAKAQDARKSMPAKLLKLQQKVSNLEFTSLDIERKHLDAQMQVGIERHARLAMSIKLATTQARLEDQTAMVESLQEQLAESKRKTRAYSSQVEDLSDELQRARVEARESLEDKNQSLQKYRMDFALMRDDLNNSFCRL